MESIRPFPSLYSFKNVFYAGVRALLGLLLFTRGINFVFKMDHLQEMVRDTGISSSIEFLSYLISITHLAGGALIILGLITRVAILFQIPILIAAVIFNIASDVFGKPSELILSIVVLALLIFYLVKGPGEISMDTYRKTHQL